MAEHCSNTHNDIITINRLIDRALVQLPPISELFDTIVRNERLREVTN